MRKLGLLLILSATSLIFSSHRYEEGMFPLSDLNKIDFKEAGFNISQQDIFNPDGISLTNALVRLGGCTGSFISEDGLIITNHHCVFGAVSNASTVENNYLEHGFMAKTREDEIPTGIECKITRSYEDVSGEVLQGVNSLKTGQERKEKINANIKEIVKRESEENKDLQIEVSEMFVGRTYVLFRYEILKDTRLVYVPPRQIGEFGGDSDNWEWPRHTGDFSIVRAYSGSDNKSAEYSKDNKPYNPQKFLKINPKGVQEDDLVFILGYPGRTFRHQPAEYIEYQQDFLLPYISDWYGFKINTMMDASRNIGDEARYLKFASNIKRLANVKKNFEGKMQGLQRTNLLQTKVEQDIEMKSFATKQNMGEEYETVLDRLNEVYKINNSIFNNEYTLTFLNNDIGYYKTALFIAKTQLENAGNAKGFWLTKTDELNQLLNKRFTENNQDIELLYFKELLKKLDKGGIAPKSYSKAKDKDKWAESLFSKNMKERVAWLKLLEKNPGKFQKVKSPMIDLAKEMLPHINDIRTKREQINSDLNILIPIYTELKHSTATDLFAPDANSTLRFTYGYMRGYSPNDGVYQYPLSSIDGVVEKFETGLSDYHLPDNLRTFFDQKQYPEILLDKNSGKPVVCMLYNLDTTGGNSGSPIMDKDGNLVGVNFDRAYTATINDFAWNEKYSRSIGVDIRYVIYIMKYFSAADELLQEMGVSI